MAATSGIKTGIGAKVYRNTASGGTKYASPTWAEISLIRDVSIGQAWDMVSADIRATKAKLYHPTQVDIAPQAIVRCDNADTAYLALNSASQTGATLDLLILDDAISTEGAVGVRAYFHLSDTGQDQSIGAVLYKTFDLKPGFGVDDNGDPAYPKIAVAGASSSVTYTDPGTSL